MLTLLLPASPARNEPLQPDEKALEDTAFSHFLARQESPQFAAVRGLMQQATTLGAFRRLAADPEAMRSAEALRARATTEPQMLSVLSDQARRIRADPQLMATMSAMQRVLADPSAPLPSAAGDGLPMPKMDLAELLSTYSELSSDRAAAFERLRLLKQDLDEPFIDSLLSRAA